MYLIGASPAVCASFVQGNPSHSLQPIGDHQDSYYLPFSTSLRMGDLGYTSQAQSGINVCYNDLDEYISALRNAILTTHQPYSAFSQWTMESVLSLMTLSFKLKMSITALSAPSELRSGRPLWLP